MVTESESSNTQAPPDIKRRAYQFSVDILKMANALPEKKLQSILINQLVRSGTSIGANIIEAKAASSKRDFGRFYDIALKSANETKYWLCLLRDGMGIPSATIAPLLQEAKELSNILGASLITLRKKRD